MLLAPWSELNWKKDYFEGKSGGCIGLVKVVYGRGVNERSSLRSIRKIEICKHQPIAELDSYWVRNFVTGEINSGFIKPSGPSRIICHQIVLQNVCVLTKFL